MDELKNKYAEVILKFCLNIDITKPLFISYEIEASDFVRIVASKAYEMGVKDIYLDAVDSYLKHDVLKYLSVEECKKTMYWNKEVWNEYAKKDAAFLMLVSEMPGLMDDIDPKKIKELVRYSQETRKVFDEKRAKSELIWNISAVPTKLWSSYVFKNSKNPLNDLWNSIFKICMIDKEDPIKCWKEKLNNFTKAKDKLNEYKFKKLIYKNKKGTDFTVCLPDKHKWLSGLEITTTNREYLPNFPTEEIFTSPDYKTANGILYSSKPLIYQGNIIEDFNITFENGKAVKWESSKGNDILKELISNCSNSNFLGEVALVEYDSAISKTNLVFFETLFDENASCHVALGDSFPECYENGPSMSKKELYNLGLNNCNSHIDFMIGTEDLEIVGITEDEKIKIFENGKFSSVFK